MNNSNEHTALVSSSTIARVKPTAKFKIPQARHPAYLVLNLDHGGTGGGRGTVEEARHRLRSPGKLHHEVLSQGVGQLFHLDKRAEKRGSSGASIHNILLQYKKKITPAFRITKSQTDEIMCGTVVRGAEVSVALVEHNSNHRTQRLLRLQSSLGTYMQYVWRSFILLSVLMCING